MISNRRLILAMALTLATAMTALAQGRGDRQQGGPQNQTFTERYGQQLGLTDAQKTQIDDLEKKFQADNATFIATFQKTMSDYRAARQANDSAKIEELRPVVESQRAQMTKLRGAFEDTVAGTFTDSQKELWTKIKAEREARMKERASHG